MMTTATVDFAELIGQAQKQTIAGIREMQDFSLRTTKAALDRLPTPAQVVESSFGYAEEILKLQKDFARQAATVLTDAKSKPAG
jgi:hypothetical protein